MPKKNHVIPRFNGLILDIAKEDLPDGVLANNTRNAHFDESGNIIGFTPESSYLSAGVSNPIYAGKFKAEDGTKLFHIQSGAPDSLKFYDPPSTSVTTVNLSHGNSEEGKISHAQRLNSMVIGTGPGATQKPVWVGKHKHQQFGQAAPAGYEAYDAELASPTELSNDNNFPRASGVARTGGRSYIISEDGNNVIKFNGQTKEIESDVRFQNPTCICLDSVSGYIWIYDSMAKTLFRLDSSLEVTNSIFLSGLPDDGKYVIDIVVGNNAIWLARDFPEKDYRSMEDYLYQVPRSTMTTNASVINNSFKDFDRNTFYVGSTVENWDRADLLSTEIKLGDQALVTHGGQAYLIAKLQTEWEFTFERAAEEQGQYINPTETIIQIDNDLHMVSGSVPTPQNFDSTTGNTVLLKLEPTESPENYKAEQVTLLIGNKDTTATDWLTEDGSYFYMFNYNYQDSMKRLRITAASIAGNDSYTAAVTTITGFHSNNIQPAIAYDGGVGYFFSRNAPAKTGTLSGTAVTNITQSAGTILIEAIPGGFSEEDKIYYYAFSFLYDGYMESPLSSNITGRAPQEGFGFKVTLSIPESNINRRVSHVNIYRAEGDDSGRLEYFRIVQSVSLEANLPRVLVDGSYRRTIEYNDRKNTFEQGPSFEANAGFPETLQNTMVHYSMSEMIEDYLFVGDCYHPDVEEAQYMIFRSLPYSICSFNHEVDVLRFPSKPTAMAYFNGRLMVFDESDMYIVDPANMVIEDTIKDMGAINSLCVRKYEGGIFIAGKTHCWQYGSNGLNKISDRIRLHAAAETDTFTLTPAVDAKNALRDYQYLVENASNLHVTVDEKASMVYIFGTISSATVGYVYNYSTQQWSRYLNPWYSFGHSLPAERGQLLAYKSSSVDYLFGNTTPLPGGSEYHVELKPFDAGDQNIEKWYYEIRVDYIGSSANINCRVAVDEGNYSGNLAQSNGVFTIPIGGAYYKGTSLRVLLIGTVKIRSVSIIYRPKIVRS